VACLSSLVEIIILDVHLHVGVVVAGIGGQDLVGFVIFLSFLGLLLRLDHLNGSLGVVASLSEGGDSLLKAQGLVGVVLDELQHSGIDLNVFQLGDDSELDRDGLAEREASWTLEREHESIVLLVFGRKLVRNGIFSNFDRDVDNVVGHGLDLVDWDLNRLEELLLSLVEEADEFATFLVGPMGVIPQRNLEVDRVEWGRDLDILRRLDDLSSLEFVATTAFPGAAIVLSLGHLVHPPGSRTAVAAHFVLPVAAWSSSVAAPATSGTTSAAVFGLVFLPHVHAHLDHFFEVFLLILLAIGILTRSLRHRTHESAQHTKWIHWHVLGHIRCLTIIFNGSDQNLGCLSVLLDLQESVWMWLGGLAVLTVVEVLEDGALVTDADDRTLVAAIADDVVVHLVGVEGLIKQ